METKAEQPAARVPELPEPHLRLVQNSKPLSDEAALAQLRVLEGKINMAGLARAWNWPRSRVSRRIKVWTAAGELPGRAPRHNGTRLRPDGLHESRLDRPQPAKHPDQASNLVSMRVSTAQEEKLPDDPPNQASLYKAAAYGSALTLAAIALAIAWFGLRINAWYGAALGRTAEAGALLAGLSITADLLALVLPAIARLLWLAGRRAVSATAWCIWSVTLVVTLLASIGFASVNISDTAAARGKVAAETAALTAKLDRLRLDRAGISERRSVAGIEAEIQQAQPRARSAWKKTAGCHDVTAPRSGAACAEVLVLREALGVAQRRDALDAEMHDAEAALARLPAVGAIDPQTETAAKLLDWLTLSTAGLSAADIHMARIAGMTLLPQLAGLVLMLAMAAARPARD
jgi:hypothetical protein